MKVRNVIDRDCKKTTRLQKSLFASTALALLSVLTLPLHAQELPSGASIQSGDVSIITSGFDMTVDQSSHRAIVNWSDFSVGAGNSVNFIQPNSASAILNRVTSSTTSNIAGSITANGQVFLINPNGIAITSSGNIQVGSGFVASSLNITDQNFLSDHLTFEGSGSSANVSNAGVITVGRDGYAALIGGTVRNDGLIAVPYGRIGLGSGEQAVLDFSGDGFLQVAVPTITGAEGDGALIDHSGTIEAEGGTVVIRAATAREAARNAVNLSGVVEAKSVSGKNGAIVIGGDQGGTVKVSGKVNTSSTSGKGGKITVTGKDISLAAATVNASGALGGGTIKIGGDWHGNASTERSTTTAIDQDTIIRADATDSGHGGTVVVWSDEKTRFDGLITARGAGLMGNGGDVEVSGQRHLSFTGFADLTASHGRFGSLLLDPYNVLISNAADSHSSGFTANGNDSIIAITTLQNQLSAASVTVSTGTSGSQDGNITLKNALTWSANTTLTLQAAGDIYFDAALTATGQTAGLVIQYGTGKDYHVKAPITLSSADATLKIGQTGNLQSYRLLHSMADIEAINTTGLSGNYALAQSLTSTTIYTQSLIGPSGSAYDPSYATGLSGIFTGLGNTISDFTIEKTSSDINSSPYQYYGLFGLYGGHIRDIGLTGGSISTNHSDLTDSLIKVYSGGLIGYNKGIISNAYATGDVSISQLKPTAIHGVADAYAYAGGLIGHSYYGNVINSYATGNVSISVLAPTANNGDAYAIANAGGLIGFNYAGPINNAYATGNISISELTPTATNSFFNANARAYSGGLIGYNDFGTVDNVNAAGNVSVSEMTSIASITKAEANAGGLIGFNYAGPINNAYATGNISISNLTAALTNANANSSAYAHAGGLIGYNDNSSITSAYATGNISISNLTPTSPYAYASANRGGLIGYNAGTATSSYFDLTTSGTHNAVGGGDTSGMTGMTTWQLQSLNSYAGNGWDFENIWAQPSTGYYPQLYSITPVISVTIPDKITVYGQAIPLEATVYGLGKYVFGSSEQIFDSVQALLTSKATLNGSVGTYNITITNLGRVSSADGTSYRIANIVQPASLTITPASISVTADAQSRSYGAGDPNFTYQITSGQLFNGDTLSGQLATTATAASNVGNYAIGLGSPGNSNYNITYTGVDLTITPAFLSVTADAQSRSYGSANPSLTYQITSGQIYNGDNLSGLLTTTATALSDVGNYAISRGSPTYSNYSITFTGANLEVTQAALTISANNASKFYDGLAYSGNNGLRYSGFVNGDSANDLSGAYSFGGTAEGAIHLGTYSITLSGLSAQNYAISYIAGQLTITPVVNPSPSGHHLSSRIFTPSMPVNPFQRHWRIGVASGSGEIFNSLLMSGSACLGASGWGACGSVN